MNLIELQKKCEKEVFASFGGILEKNYTKENFIKNYLIEAGFCKITGFDEKFNVLREYQAFIEKGYDDDDLYFDISGSSIFLINRVLRTSSYQSSLDLSFPNLKSLTKSEYLKYLGALDVFEASLFKHKYEKQGELIERLNARIEELETKIEELETKIEDLEMGC